MNEKGAMTLEQSIRDLATEGTVAALETHLPALLERLTLPPDANHRHSIKEAAARLRLPISTFRERIKAGEIEVTRDGKYSFVLEEDLTAYNRKLRDRERFRRDQRAPTDAEVPEDIKAILAPKPARAAKR